MSLTVVGSIAFDAVKTPFGERERMLGGSAVHFSLAASFFTDVRVVGPVGDDFGEDGLLGSPGGVHHRVLLVGERARPGRRGELGHDRVEA